jgi:uncharacterized protein (TIGR00290 family)
MSSDRKTRVVLSWSSGKDSAWALHVLWQMPNIEVIALVTTFNRQADRVAMHAVRRKLVLAQAERVGLPLWPVELPWPCSNQDYECLMRGLCERAVNGGATHIAFGDLYLQDVRAYREKQLQGSGLTPLFPLWQLPTRQLAQDMISAGLRAKLTCVDPKKLERSFAAREFDAALLDELPSDVDACGENGEFHTFVYAGPMFQSGIPVKAGETVERDGFVFADVVPIERAANWPNPGLCGSCCQARVITSDRGSEFYRCMLSDTDARYPRYPRLPVLRCEGWQQAGD